MGFNRGFHDDCCSRRKTGVVLSRADNLNRILSKLNCSDDPVGAQWGVGNGVLARLERDIEGEKPSSVALLFFHAIQIFH